MQKPHLWPRRHPLSVAQCLHASFTGASNLFASALRGGPLSLLLFPVTAATLFLFDPPGSPLTKRVSISASSVLAPRSTDNIFGIMSSCNCILTEWVRNNRFGYSCKADLSSCPTHLSTANSLARPHSCYALSPNA